MCRSCPLFELCQQRELQGAIRIARSRRRRRRELKLLLLLAMTQHAEGHLNLARRSLIEALEIGKTCRFVRSFLDEQAPVLLLLKDLRRQLGKVNDLSGKESLLAYIDHLLTEAGETVVATPVLIGSGAAFGESIDTLTEKERRLLRYVAIGFSNRDLAARLSVSTNTVKWHLRNIFEKLHIKTRTQAVAVARRMGLVE